MSRNQKPCNALWPLALTMLALVVMPGTPAGAIVAGDPNGSPADSPSSRIDPNVGASAFTGVGSLLIETPGGEIIGTATLIDDWHVLTSALLVADGFGDLLDIDSITFNLNVTSDLSHQIAVDLTPGGIHVHPDFTGLNAVAHDDLAVLRLTQAAPADATRYALNTHAVTAGTTFTMVGYGRSGDGITGYSTDASLTVKRVGQNNADSFIGQDDAGAPAVNEIFLYDFDDVGGATGMYGGDSLGNAIETTLGPGDSGGPSFIWDGDQLLLAAVNTFVSSAIADPDTPAAQYVQWPLFNSTGGGVLVDPYVDWINSVVPEPTTVSLLMLGLLGAAVRRRKLRVG